jgi:S-DNA-T family DNA segregation ATPase FtsK/SpoIIIE
LLIYGTEGAGTAAVLASLAIGAAERYSADDLHLYVIDAGVLAPLAALPHTGVVVGHDEVGRVTQLVELVGQEMDRRASASTRESLPPHLVVMIDDVGALRDCLDDHWATDRSNADDVWAEFVRIATDGPAYGVSTIATARRERDVPADFAAQMPSRLVMQLADPSGYTSFGFRPIDLPRFVPGRALDPVDRVELQIAEAPTALADAIEALAAEPARVRPPLTLEERSA